MTEFIGTIVNKTTGVSQNVVEYNKYLNTKFDAKVEGDDMSHIYYVKDYDFIPKRKTFQKQFDELKVGDVFTIPGYTGYRVKVTGESYWTSTFDNTGWASNVDPSEDIIKKED